MTLLLTGATGFLGWHLLDQLPRDQDILVLVRDAKAWTRDAWATTLPHVRPVEGSLNDLASLRLRVAEMQVKLTGLYHAAALVQQHRRHAAQVHAINVDGTLNMVRLAGDHGCRMLFVSTSGTVGCFRNRDAAADENAKYCHDIVSGWPYYVSKIEAETRAAALAATLHVELVMVRPPMLLGPGDHRLRATRLVLRFLRGRLPFLMRGGFHYVDVRDAAAAMIRAMALENPRPIYHLPGTASSVDDFFAELAAVSGQRRPRLHLPYSVAWAMAMLDDRLGGLIKGAPLGLVPEPVSIEMGAHYWGLTSLYAERELGFKPRPGRETLVDTVAWLRGRLPSVPRP